MSRPLRIIIGCEWSGEVRDACRALGHEAFSCDVVGPDQLPDEFRAQRWPNYHLEGDVLDFIGGIGEPWDLGIFFPPCTYLCSSGLHWNRRRPERQRETDRALRFVARLMDAPIAKIAIENPRGCIGTKIRPADQSIQPYHFGHDASKETMLWLKNLPKLTPTSYVPPRIVDGRPRWSNQTDSGQNRLTPSETRARERGRTYAGIAQAMAEQWAGRR